MSQKDIDRLPQKDRPYVDNYPALRDFLDKHEARCMWQVACGLSYVECWQAGAHPFIVQVYPKGNGFEIYTSSGIQKTDEFFAEVAERISNSE